VNGQEQARLTRFVEWLMDDHVGEFSREEVRAALNMMAGYAWESGVIYAGTRMTDGEEAPE